MTSNETNTKGQTMDAKFFSYSVCFQMPTCKRETIVRARSKSEAEAKVLAWQPDATAVRWVVEVEGERGWV